MQKLRLKLCGTNFTREIICPYSNKNAIREWLREFYPESCKFFRIEEI